MSKEEGAHQAVWPDGHFYSAIPSVDDIDVAQRWRADWSFDTTPGIDLDPVRMVEFCHRLGDTPHRHALAPTPAPDGYYGYENGQFNRADAAVLSAILAFAKPERVVEIGSGYSTACMLDARTAHGLTFHLNAIEPYPNRLFGRLRERAPERFNVLETKVQDVPLHEFSRLATGDILFIDSSHVAKAGSDVAYEFLQIIPTLGPGVYVHVHDIFPGFEYPLRWQQEGRYWTEAYLLRALLIDNARLEVVLWPAALTGPYREEMHKNLPEMAGMLGGSIWLRVRSPGNTDLPA